VVGEATAEPQLTVTDSHFGNSPVDMPLEVLLGKAPRMHRSVVREASWATISIRRPSTSASASSACCITRPWPAKAS
jgi:phosphoribosylformylglycinamidine (FGAM) synthase-like enzyme